MHFAQMYHHFHDDEFHPVGQGSINADTFDAIIRQTLKRGYSFLQPEDYMRKALGGVLEDHHTVLTFDDSLRCQFDVALPVMDQHDIRGFFFCYTNLNLPDATRLEFFRDFRNVFFQDIEVFYEAFFRTAQKIDGISMEPALRATDEGYLSECSFFSYHDKVYRFLRDYVMGPQKYDLVMEAMMTEYSYPLADRAEVLLMTPEMIRELVFRGHAVGLHSHTHPMVMTMLSEQEQRAEYAENHALLKDLTGVAPVSMSHPCGHYNATTLAVLRSLGVTVGFRSTVSEKEIRSPLEIPREDHANLVRNWLCA